MTGCHISIGYLSGGNYDKDEAWEVLKKVVLDLCHNPHHLMDELVLFGMNPRIASECAAAYVNASEATRGTEDSTLRIIEAKDGDPPQIMQLAGGSSEWRVHKEATRRAFCRLVMREMHKLEVEVNINVA